MNGIDLLVSCLQSLRDQTFKDFEIIVVDNGSSTDVVNPLNKQFPEVRIIPLGENLGFSKASNIGIQHSQGKYIALLNNDTETDPCWLEELVKVLDEYQDIGFCASRILCWKDRNLIDACGDYYTVDGMAGKIGHLKHASEFTIPREVFGASAGASIYRRMMLDDIGLLDEDFFLAYEDSDLSCRAQLMGYKCLYVPTAVVYHHVSATIGPDSNTYIYYGHRNIEWVYIKNMPTLLLLKFLPLHLLIIISLAVLYIFKGKFRPYAKAKVSVLRSLPKLLKKRRQIQKQRRVSTSEIEQLLWGSWFLSTLRGKLVRN